MSEKEYIVSLNKGVDYEAFNQEMIASTGAGAIPSRSTSVANARPASQRNTHYMLTDEEAIALRSDARVYGVTLLPENDPDLVLVPRAIQRGDFTKTTSDRGNFLNWGMRRMNEAVNPYSGTSVEGGYNYTLDGTGVDVVIMDSGLQIDHPEFQDADGESRVVELDWTTESAIPGMPAQSANYYRDHDGHGTHVAGTAAGKTYGWAKNAKIYSLKLAGLEGATDAGTGTGVSYAFDCIKEWHNRKPNDPETGVKRPTVVNMSWGYLRYYDNISSITYRGTTYTGSDVSNPNTNWTNYGLVPFFDGARFRTNTRVDSVDVDMEELIEAGVHVMVAAGNRSHKVDVPNGDDYDNELNANTGSVFYHRGSSPYSLNAHIVGNIDSQLNAGGLEQKATSSETGPGVSVYAPGTDIMSAMSTINKFGADTLNNPYPADSNYLINNITGTSMASPQIAGMLSLWLQINPSATPAQGLSFINTTAKTDQIYGTGNTTDYDDNRSLLGGANRFGFNRFNSATQLRIGNPTNTGSVSVAQPTYSLSASAASVNEGETVTITLTTTNVDNGTTVAYSITGVDTDDINQNLTGNFTVNNDAATLEITLAEDLTTEGAETLTVSLVNVSASINVTINDTSLDPTYSVTPAANNINEGANLTMNVATTGVSDGTVLYWTVSAPGEFNTSSGNFTINSDAGSFTVTPAADALTEGSENFSVSIRTNGVGGAVVATSTAIAINDISGTPSGTVYDVTVASGTNVFGTGNKYYIDGFAGPSPTLNLIEGQTYIFRQDDPSNATHQLLFSETANGSWAGGIEYISGVTKVGTPGELGAYVQIAVGNGAPTLHYYCLNHSGMGGTANTPNASTPTYDSLVGPADVDEGSIATFTITTQNITNGTTVDYTLTGISVDDLATGALTGNTTINGNTATIEVALANDATTEGAETLTVTLNGTDSVGTSTGSLSANTTINDTSTTPAPTYSATPAANNIDEGSTLTINVTTSNVADATTLYWTATNSGDFATSSGSFVINSDAGTISVTPTADTTTEGAESFQVQIRTGSISGSIVDTTDAIIINDTSTAPAFTPDYTITVTHSGNSYNLSGTDRNGSVSGSQPTLTFNSGDNVRFAVNAGTASAHPFYIKTTQSTGTGNQVSGATGQGTVEVDWTTATDGAGSYGYQCSIHFSMWNTITIN